MFRPESVVLYCTRPKCGAGYGSIGEIPRRCPSCGLETRWTTTPPCGDIPTIPYILTRGDRKLLKDRGIATEPESA